MLPHGLKTRKPQCAGMWYPFEKQKHGFKNNPESSAVISPHAGFSYSGMVSLEAVSHVRKNRVWFLGTSHYESPQNGISIFHGNYSSSIGKALFPRNLDKKDSAYLKNIYRIPGIEPKNTPLKMFCTA